MTNNAVNRVLYNVDQTSDTTAAEKAQARANIGAQGALTAGPNVDIINDVISTEKPRVEAGTNVSVNSVLDPQTRVITYTVSATDTTYNIFNTTTDGLVPKANGTGDTGKFLKGDGTWEAISTTVNATAPLYGTGTQADPIRLLVSNGLSLVQPAGGDTALQVTHPVPAPGSTSAGKVLTCDDALENLSWQAPAAPPSIVQKLDYGDTSASTVSTLLIDADDPEGYAVVKCDGSNKGALVQGPFKTLLDSGVNGIGDTTTPVYVDANGQFATCSITPGGPKRSNTAELYFHHAQDGDHYAVRNVKNYCINHVAVNGHSGDICYVEIESPTLDGTGEEYDYVVVFDCTNSSGSTTHVTVQNADPEIFTYPLTSASTVVQMTQTLVYFDGSVRSQIEVLGGRFTVHSY